MKHKLFVCVLAFLLITSCKNDVQRTERSETHTQNTDTLSKSIINNDTNYKGITFIKEQLVISILDSASSIDASQKMKENYDKLLVDVEQIDAKIADQPGCIFYSTSPEKIVFETFMFLKSPPKKTPKHSKLVVLERTQALLYDHYGTFNTIHQSYTSIKKILDEMGYEQAGPTREVYILNEDTAKWRTRIIVPVIKKQ